MGQFLATGLVTEMSISKKEVEQASINLEQLITELKKEFYYDTDIFTLNEKEDYYHFVLKEEVLAEQLIPFLESIYPHLHENSKRYQGVLEKLRDLPASEWLEWSERKSEYSFQNDSYGMSDCLDINGQNVFVHYNAILLAMEGKILMETFGEQFRFFKYAIMQAFKEFSLAKALRIYITG